MARFGHPSLRIAATLLRAGGVVAYPTEAVWGLGCDPGNPAALARVLALKGRDPGKGLILIAAELAMLRPFLRGLDHRLIARMAATWPGPVTWLIPDNGVALPAVTGGRGTLAVRVSAHPVAAALSHAFGGPIVSTSANPQGLPPATRLPEVKAYFGAGVDYYTPGRVGARRRPSEIRDLMSGAVVRPG
ncbi:MAG: L-threonylcarbamoyladenylate synthase [Gammaproteobacteria bacterium]|nr:L-threonylcarbamoyladenylate synthase [Gammaproteobacteria bacterium]